MAPFCRSIYVTAALIQVCRRTYHEKMVIISSALREPLYTKGFTKEKNGRLKFHNVINLRVVRNIFHISHYFYCKYAIIVVRKEVGVFIKILTKTYKGEKRYYASLVENKRIDGKVVQRVKANLGPVTEEQIPYLKAAYARKKPHLVYDDE